MQRKTQRSYSAWDKALTDTPESQPERRSTLADIAGILKNNQPKETNHDTIQLEPTQSEHSKQEEGLVSQRKNERSPSGNVNMGYRGNETDSGDITRSFDDVSDEPTSKDLKDDKTKKTLRRIVPLVFLGVVIIAIVLAVIFAIKSKSGQEIPSTQAYYIQMKLDDMDYLPQMSDPKNKLFETLQFAICQTFRNVFAVSNKQETVHSCSAYNFTKGSVIAWITLSINTTVPKSTLHFLKEEVPIILYNRRFNKYYIIVPFDINPNHYNISSNGFYAKENDSGTGINNNNNNILTTTATTSIVDNNIYSSTTNTVVINFTTENINNNGSDSTDHSTTTNSSIPVVDPFTQTTSIPTILVTRVMQHAQVEMSTSLSMNNRPYLEAYANKTSPEYQEMQSEFCGTVTTALEAETGFSHMSCKVDSLGHGSLIVNFTVGFNSTVEMSRQRMDQFITDAQTAIGKVFTNWVRGTLDVPELNKYNITRVTHPEVVRAEVQETNKTEEVKVAEIQTCDTFNGGCEHGCSMVYDVISCSCRHGYRLAADKHHCLHDPCTPNPCEHGSACLYVEETRDYKCVCPAEYSGKNCETEICQPVMVEKCKNSLPYSSTMIPNKNYNSPQNETELKLGLLSKLPDACQNFGLKFLCSFYLPECVLGGSPKYPCRESCEHFVDDCAGETLNKTFCSALPSTKEGNCHQVEGFQTILPVKLVGGASPSEGVVQVFWNGQWSDVCDSQWTSVDATVVCKTLGFRGLGTPTRSSHFKENSGSGNPQIGNVTCSVENQNLKECNLESATATCNEKDKAAVICQSFEVRLVGPESPRKGSVEVMFNGKWGTICDDHWNNSAAEAVCKMLGYTGRSIALSASFFGSASEDTPIWLDDVKCPRGVSSLTECRHLVVGNHNCKHNEDASVICNATEDDIPKLEVRLVNGSSPLEGRVEVKYDGVWGTVCDDHWGPNAAYAVCAMLGYTNGTAFPTSGGSFGQGTGPILFDDVICDEGADWLLQCSHQPIGHSNCQHSEDAGVICGTTFSSVIRLAGGSNSSEGRVEVYMDGKWGTVCDDFWDDKDADVVCKMLQISGRAKAIKKGQFGAGSGPIHLDDVGCSGNERSLFDCQSPGIGVHNCGHKEDAGVICGLEPLRIEFPVSRPNPSELPTTTATTTATTAPSMKYQCPYPVTVEECKRHVPWNFTNQHRQNWVQDLISLHQMKSLFSNHCYKYAGVFLCTYFVGGCSPYGVAVPPCKQLCEEFVNNCYHQLPRTFIFLCDFLPDESSGLPCVSKNTWIYSSGLQGDECPFRCSSGECLPDGWTCDGVPDCPLGEDEKNCTGSNSSVSCDFETGICGWETNGVINANSTWRRITRNKTTIGWPADHSTRFDGYYLYLNGQNGMDQLLANITTPELRVASPKCLTFFALVAAHNSSIEMFAKYSNGSTVAKVLDIATTAGSTWARQTLDLPVGTFRLVFQGHCGETSVVAIDDVYVENGKCPRKLDYIVRLDGGFNSRSGIIKIKAKGTNQKEKFKRICTDSWDEIDASVICRQISVRRKVNWVATVPVTGSHFNLTEISEFGMTRTKCRGIEDNVGRCKHDVPQNELCRGEPAGVMCVSGIMTYRLVEGNAKGHGRLEMFMDGTWFNLCEHFWDTKETIAVCQTMGFIGEGKKVTSPNKVSRLPHRLTLALNITCPRREIDIKGCNINWKQLNIANDTECSPLWLQCETQDTTHQISKETPNCDFESPDLCGFEMDDSAALKWVQHNTSTPSVGTGPDMDHSLSGGNFLYMEASSPAKPHDHATLRSKKFNVTSESPRCMRFFYHMHGKDVGSLSVYSSNGSQALLAQLQGPMENAWRTLSIRLPPGDNQYLIFTATRGNGYHGDIAIDDIVVGPHVCFEHGCGPDYFQCSNGGCIPDYLVGNNYPDCPNGTDETSDVDNPSFLPCGDGVKLPIEYGCNGYPDCENGQDEIDCDCLEDEVVCQNGRCISQDFICDEVNDCGDGSDEMNCACEPGYKRCPEGGQCIKEDDICGWSGCLNHTSCTARCNFTGNLCDYKSVHPDAVYWAAVEIASAQGTHHWTYMDNHAVGLSANLVSPVQDLTSGGCLVFDFFAAPESNSFVVSVNTSAMDTQEIWMTNGSPLPRNVSSIEFERVHLQLPPGRIAVTFTGVKRARGQEPGGFALDYVDILNRPCKVNETVPGISCNFSSGSICKWSSNGLSFQDNGLTISEDSLLKGRMTIKYKSPVQLCLTINYKEAYGGYLLTGLLSHYNNLTGYADLNSTYVFGPFITNDIGQSFINISRGDDDIFVDVIRGSINTQVTILNVYLTEGVCSANQACYGYPCKLVKQCVSSEKVCDGIPDCMDQSDETECRESESYHAFRSVSGFQVESSNNRYMWRQWWGRSADIYGTVLSAKHRVALPSVSYHYYQDDRLHNYFEIHGIMGRTGDESSLLFDVPRGMTCLAFSYAISDKDALYIYADDTKIWQMFGKRSDTSSSVRTYRDSWWYASVTLTNRAKKVAIKAVRGLAEGSVSIDNVVFSSACRSDNACQYGYFSCGDGKCLSPSKVCDGISDCFDNKDETTCAACIQETQWNCRDSQCINKTGRCDGETNCYDGSDEIDCHCEGNEFQCAITKKCIASTKRCDGYLDCNYRIGDTSDEENCNRSACGHEYFPCTLSGLCLPLSYICNGENDCGDQSDERHPNCVCDEDELRCDGQCIPSHFICDGRQHCSDNSDEEHCPQGMFNSSNPHCGPGLTRCVTGECAPLEDACYGKTNCQVVRSDDELCQSLCKPEEFECDGRCHNVDLWGNGVTNCIDGQDEAEGYSCHPTLQLQCDNGLCFMNYQYCDGKKDCMDGADEPPHCSCIDKWHFQCKSDGRCLPKLDQCDGKLDCSDHSDEANCTCTKDQIRCDMGMCIDKAKWCDGVTQCPDESDEKANCSANCTNTQFLCPDRCIPQSMRCDGKSDCFDNSDEIGCTCPDGMKQCASGKCLSPQYWCNGVDNCGDMTDEIHCKCMNWQFQCQIGICIDKTLVCNQDDDCGDNSDEADCPCSDDHWRCSSGKCIIRDWLCDGEEDCPDGEDEKTCNVCNSTQFRCKRTLDCIDLKLRCDGVPNCKDDTDEHSCVLSSNITVGKAAVPIVKIYHQGAMVPVCSTRWRESMSETVCAQTGQGPPTSTSSQTISTLGNPAEFQSLLLAKDGVLIIDALQGNFQPVNASQCDSVVSVICQQKECGKRQVSTSSKLVVGGEFAELGSWPWMTSLRIFNQHHCGGTLINDRWIITAAHCMEGIGGSLWGNNVRMGSLLRNGNDTNAVVIYLEKYFVHPGFNGITFENDIALLKLGKKVTFNNYIQPVCLPGQTATSLTDRCYVTGWGRVKGQAEQIAPRLKEAKLKIMSHSLCHRIMEKRRPVVDRIMTCAGYTHGRVTACHADSGGPLVCQDEHGRWTLTGVVSWGTSDCTGTPTVFARVSAYQDWIRQVIAENS